MCGIFGIINNEPRNFDYKTFCTLGINNDERGGDSCGVFIDGNYEYGVGDKKLFANFYEDSTVIQNCEKSKIAVGHCRKASVGAVNQSTAQPVIIKNENDEVEFVVIHNGTIYNYQELAKKYIPDFDIKDMTDSQVMTRIFYEKGYDVLGEYNGGAVFVIIDYREDKNEPKIMFWKGASLASSVSQVITEERPLYFVHENNRLVFSSIPKYLKCCKKKLKLYTFKMNELTELTKNKLYIVNKYDREKLYQFKVSTYAYSLYDDYDGYNSWEGKKNNLYLSNARNNYFGQNNNGITKSKSLESSFNSGVSAIKKAKGDLFLTSNEDGTYSIDNILAHGCFRINCDGEIQDIKNESKDSYIFYFWEGVLLYNKKCYKLLKKIAALYQITQGDVMETFPTLVHGLSPDPFIDTMNAQKEEIYYSCTSHNGEECVPAAHVEWQYFTSTKIFYFDAQGAATTVIDAGKQSAKSTFYDYKRMCEKENIDFAEIIDLYKVY